MEQLACVQVPSLNIYYELSVAAFNAICWLAYFHASVLLCQIFLVFLVVHFLVCLHFIYVHIAFAYTYTYLSLLPGT